MLVIHGKTVFSPFRSAQLLGKVQAITPDVKALEVSYVYWLKGDITPPKEAILKTLFLGEGYTAPILPSPLNVVSQSDPSVCSFYVVPRLGTFSPWSSKASDLLAQAGFSGVEVERGRMVVMQGVDAVVTEALIGLFCDRMTESMLSSLNQLEVPLENPRPLQWVDIQSAEGKASLNKANKEMGLALSGTEIDYLYDSYQALGRNPTDVELMMFAQANSEHCRHKVFNASWTIAGEKAPRSLFQMIQNTFAKSPAGVLSAYKDNAAVISGFEAGRFYPALDTKQYSYHVQPIHTMIKVETHNHPTAIAPFPGAATGVGGEIRDEGATGRGAKPKAGLVGFTVSHLRIPDFIQPWEKTDFGKPGRIVSPLEIMTQGPLGGAAFGNEFGRASLCGYFRTFEADHGAPHTRWGYHKPIMIAGGMGNIAENQIKKIEPLPHDVCLIVLGGPAMLIGLGGGAASSQTSSDGQEQLDFASVQRDNPEMERRCQEVIDHCWQLGTENPILFIHDVGAGGLSNALPELVKDGGCGGVFDLRHIFSIERALSPLEIWCNEAQERYVLAVSKEKLAMFDAMCARERCPFRVVGYTTAQPEITVKDPWFDNAPVQLPNDVLFGHPPKMEKHFTPEVTPEAKQENKVCSLAGIDLSEAIERVLRFPAVASKKFLITIADRSVGGLTVRDQMVGPWQVPVADCAVTATGFNTFTGEAMSMGERTPLAVQSAAASARMAVAEAVMNIASASIRTIGDIKLSANWMAAVGREGQDQALYEAVHAVGMELCPALGIAIPVGKDSLSMSMAWQAKEEHASKVEKTLVEKLVVSPLSLIVSAFAPVDDIRCSLTPMLYSESDTTLLLVELNHQKVRLAFSTLSQVYERLGDDVPDLDTPETLKAFFSTLQALKTERKILAYHDRSDGGLIVSLLEMMFASRCSLKVDLDEWLDGLVGKTDGSLPISEKQLAALFSEELGAVIQVRNSEAEGIIERFVSVGIPRPIRVAIPTFFSLAERRTQPQKIQIVYKSQVIFEDTRGALEKIWAETSYRIQALRDVPSVADSEWQQIENDADIGLHVLAKKITAPMINTSVRPKIAILREQGVNGQLEMAMSFDRAGFDAFDVHMSDLMAGRAKLSDYQGLVACGGFSYGDVLGAGTGWAQSILLNEKLKTQFASFFQDTQRFVLGVCNGCQMLSQLTSIIPGAEFWPRFQRNLSEQFEARLSMVEIGKTPSIFFQEMAGFRLPVVVSHGEGQSVFTQAHQREVAAPYVTMRFIEHHGVATEVYPYNPNGSIEGITGLCNQDGRINIMMPHPERVVRTSQFSWYPSLKEEDSAWLELFKNARRWLG